MSVAVLERLVGGHEISSAGHGQEFTAIDGARLAEEAEQHLTAVATEERETTAQSIIPLREINPEVAKQASDTIRAMRLGGFSLAAAEVEHTTDSPVYSSMYDMLLNSEHDPIAEQGALLNIKTMLGEGVKPHSNITEVRAVVDEAGMVWQFGQSALDIANNALRLDDNEVAVVESETLLSLGIMVKSGDIKPGDTVVEISIVPEGEATTLRKKGYFIHTMSYVARTITLDTDGKTLIIQSHFAAGVDLGQVEAACGPIKDEASAASREQYALDHRSDKKVVQRLFREVLNLPDATDLTAAGFLRYAGKINKDLLPGGGADIMAALDAINEDEWGAEAVFYGVRVSEKPDYNEFLDQCRRDNEELEQKARAIMVEAREKVVRHGLTTDQVPQLLRQLSKQYIAGEVLAGRADPMVLGSRAAVKAVKAMEAEERGDDEAAEALRQEAVDLTLPGGCSLAELVAKGEAGEDKYGSLSFECPNGHRNVRPRGQLVERCATCGTNVKC